ncbi:type I restriction-modification system subunit M N-terminal domain-containing protein [Candidatus Kirkpatrickella diaphorinae]|uniref:site-specific DNA-methyltransferase (adenine-specific) n=1 Tax=Candidatus Kirkpatrickella diaphorinae TaxID=2984322 RepID=A0ABY6GI90_9PROT|nr:type I restriction-modification system subunit M N-terminal domain-containing protein [Candidatus Kirkpatrickella diaphorinae]UYH51232.1 type I restriction-modification system subunit M N-terminal domain-containing protein [Candidatus Kirkpatrickella diaphorinae]
MSQKLSQDSINKALWNVCNVFRGTISPDAYRDYVLTMLFLKYISDVCLDHYEKIEKKFSNDKELIDMYLREERFALPRGASFYALYEQRHSPGSGERIDKALHAIEENNGTKLRDAGKSVFQDISFNSDRLGDEKQINTTLRYDDDIENCEFFWKEAIGATSSCARISLMSHP